MPNAFDKIGSALDRFQEAHFWIHMLEQNYHFADPLRWHLNVFLKALKETPQLLQMELQNESGFVSWYRDHRDRLNADPLIKFLAKQRDIVVHRSMLVPNSGGSLGITEMRGMKMGITFSVHPLEDSDHAMERYLQHAAEHGDFLGILIPDEDSLPCVQREWRLSGFDEELVELCARAWLRVGETIAAVLQWLGQDVPLLSLDCRHGTQKLQFKLYDRDELTKQMHDLESAPDGFTPSSYN